MIRKVSIILLFTMMICFSSLYFSGCGAFERVDVSSANSGKTNFFYNDRKVVKTLSEDDLGKIKELFDGKHLYSDEPSCGFTENVSITMDEETFYIACDSCPIIYWKNKDKYFKLSDSEYTELTQILDSYGFVFPCV